MNILVIGGDCQILPLLQELNKEQRHGITHCMTGAQAIAELKRGGNAFDWIVLEGHATAREGVTVARAVRAMGYAVPVSTVVSDSMAEPAQLTLVCAVEKIAHAPVIRACRLAGTESAPSAKAEILFEFHAPCRMKKRKSPDG